MRPTEKLANYFGYELIKTKKHPTLATHMLALIKERNIDAVIDVGANEGQFAINLRKSGFTGVIHSFEPTSEAYNKLKNNAEDDNNWFTHNQALGAEKTFMFANTQLNFHHFFNQIILGNQE